MVGAREGGSIRLDAAGLVGRPSREAGEASLSREGERVGPEDTCLAWLMIDSIEFIWKRGLTPPSPPSPAPASRRLARAPSPSFISQSSSPVRTACARCIAASSIHCVTGAPESSNSPPPATPNRTATTAMGRVRWSPDGRQRRDIMSDELLRAHDRRYTNKRKGTGGGAGLRRTALLQRGERLAAGEGAAQGTRVVQVGGHRGNQVRTSLLTWTGWLL